MLNLIKIPLDKQAHAYAGRAAQNIEKPSAGKWSALDLNKTYVIKQSINQLR